MPHRRRRRLRDEHTRRHPGGRIDLLKVDIEGAEEESFAYCQGWIGRVAADRLRMPLPVHERADAGRAREHRCSGSPAVTAVRLRPSDREVERLARLLANGLRLRRLSDASQGFRGAGLDSPRASAPLSRLPLSSARRRRRPAVGEVRPASAIARVRVDRRHRVRWRRRSVDAFGCVSHRRDPRARRDRARTRPGAPVTNPAGAAA